MFYEFDLAIPANTPASAPAELTVDLSPGTITMVEVQFPSNCVGLVHARILDGVHQVWPTSLDTDIAGEAQNVRWSEEYDLLELPYQLTLQGWNDDDTYQHTLTFRFALRAATAVAPAGITPAPPSAIIETFPLPW